MKFPSLGYGRLDPSLTMVLPPTVEKDGKEHVEGGESVVGVSVLK